MNENYQNPNVPMQGDEENIDIMVYVTPLLQNWKRIAKWGGIAMLVGLILVIDLPKRYTASSVLAPEIAQKSNMGSLSSLAAMAGINMNNMVMTDAMYPDIYPEIVNSVPFQVELFSIPVTIKRHGEMVDTDLYTYLLDYGKSPWWGKVLNAPFKGLAWVLEKVLPAKEGEDGVATIDPNHLTKKQERILKALNKSINVSVEKKTFLISIDVTMQDAEIAKQVCDEVIERLQTYVTQYRTEKARKDLAYYQKLDDEARDQYFEAQQKYATYIDANQGLTTNRNRIEQQRLQNESNLAFSLYNQTQQQVQMAKAKVQLETPVCVILKPSTVPLTGKPSRAKNLLIITFLGVAICCAWILFGQMAIDLWNQAMGKKPEEAEGGK